MILISMEPLFLLLDNLHMTLNQLIAGHPADVAGGYERHHGIPSWNLMCSSLSDSLVPEAVFFMTYFQNLYHFCKS
jgi:hypothetical protein